MCFSQSSSESLLAVTKFSYLQFRNRLNEMDACLEAARFHIAMSSLRFVNQSPITI